MRRGKQNLLAARIEIPARGTARARAHPLQIGTIDPHAVNLIARVIPTRRLEQQPASVLREIRFRILSAMSQLPDIFQVPFDVAGRRHRRGRLGESGGNRGAHGAGGEGLHRQLTHLMSLSVAVFGQEFR